MPSDLRELLSKQNEDSNGLSKNHRRKFEQKLKAELHGTKGSNWKLFQVAASITLVLGLSASLFFFNAPVEDKDPKTPKIENLGSVSPELGKIENFYLASIQTEIASLEETPENAELVNGYLQKIAELSKEYKELTTDLNTAGLNQNTINALIDNLQQRLNLLYQLNEQLDEFKKLQNDDTTTIQA